MCFFDQPMNPQAGLWGKKAEPPFSGEHLLQMAYSPFIIPATPFSDEAHERPLPMSGLILTGAL